MRIALAVCISLLAASASAAQVQGYYRKNGTYVAPHYRSAPDGNRFNNYSTQGNVNPYTGQQGYVNPYSPPAPVYTPQPYNYGTNPYYRPYGQ
jgi:hypothetical protein